MIYKCLSPEIIIDSELKYQNTPITTLTFEIKEHLNTVLQDEILTIIYPINELLQKINVSKGTNTHKNNSIDDLINKDLLQMVIQKGFSNEIKNENDFFYENAFKYAKNLSEIIDFENMNDCVYVFKIDNLNSNYIVTKIDYLSYLFKDVYLIRSALQNPIDELFYLVCIGRNENKFQNKLLISKNVDNIIDIYINYISEVQVAVDIALGIKYDSKINHFEGIDIDNETLYAIYLKKIVNKLKNIVS